MKNLSFFAIWIYFVAFGGWFCGTIGYEAYNDMMKATGLVDFITSIGGLVGATMLGLTSLLMAAVMVLEGFIHDSK